MSIHKSEIKMAVVHSIGMRLDDRLEAARAELGRFEGAKSGMNQASKLIEDLMVLVKKDAEAGKFEELAKDGDPISLKVAGEINRWIQRAVGVCISLGELSESGRLKQQGKIEALEQTVNETKQMYDEEEAKLKRAMAQSAIEVEDQSGGNGKSDMEIPRPLGEPGKLGQPVLVPVPAGGRSVGVHPGSSIAAQRKAEAAAEAAAAEQAEKPTSEAASGTEKAPDKSAQAKAKPGPKAKPASKKGKPGPKPKAKVAKAPAKKPEEPVGQDT